MKTRFPAKSYLGVQLVIGILIFAGMTLILGEISEDVINHEPLTIADAQLSTWLHTHASPALTTFLWIVTSLHSTLAVSSVAIILGLYLLWRRQPYWLAALWLSVFGGMLLNKLLKFAFHRARPHFNDPILTLTSYSFPSGHTMMATVLYGALAAFLVAKTRSWRWRALVILSAGLLIALVGFSRIYLGAHYLSDVLGAIAEGLAWLSLCLTSAYYFWRKGNPRSA
ncbi:MAG: phosphatase PAP2 family protein [Acidobacteriota bacterium]|nr:phosphatase PAP2 family protein [Acidobacteriota bacterium]